MNKLSLPVVFISFFILSFFAGSALFSQDGDSSAAPLLTETSPSMSVSAPTSVSLNLAPNSLLVTDSVPVSVTTNNPNGYSLAISVSDRENCLKHSSLITSSCEDIPDSSKIAPFATIDTDLWANSWGVKVGTNFFGITSEPRIVATNPKETINSNIAVGAKANTSILAGIYTNSVIITAVAEGVNAPVLGGIINNTGWAGDNVTIYGVGLSTAYSIQIGGEDCANASILSDMAISCTVPSLADGMHDVTVETWGGQATLSNAFQYVPFTDGVFTTEIAPGGCSKVTFAPGRYRVELWGSQGGRNQSRHSSADYVNSQTSDAMRGKGSYVKGDITLAGATPLFICTGNYYDFSTAVSFNGGGGGINVQGNNSNERLLSGTGGGATDIRLAFSGTWNEITSLRSRIIVAAGGAAPFGTTTVGGYYGGNGAHAGGLVGYNGSSTGAQPGGGTQVGTANTVGSLGSFGSGGASCGGGSILGGNGGGGYYGGNGGQCAAQANQAAGAGGSSFISGHTGAVAVESAASTSPRAGTGGAACDTSTTDNLCSVHYSGLKFTNTVMIDGSGNSWTNISGSQQQMPNPNGGLYPLGSGHTSAGFARITYLGN
jgi:hypothetical protein